MATESAAEAGPSSSTNDAADDDSYQVERILSMKTVGGVRHFLVKWLGYDEEDDNTWEPEEHLEGSQLLIRRFERERAAEAKQPRKGKGKEPAHAEHGAAAAADDGGLELPPGWKCRRVEDEHGSRLQWSDAKAHTYKTRERAAAAIQRWHERQALEGESPAGPVAKQAEHAMRTTNPNPCPSPALALALALTLTLTLSLALTRCAQARGIALRGWRTSWRRRRRCLCRRGTASGWGAARSARRARTRGGCQGARRVPSRSLSPRTCAARRSGCASPRCAASRSTGRSAASAPPCCSTASAAGRRAQPSPEPEPKPQP